MNRLLYLIILLTGFCAVFGIRALNAASLSEEYKLLVEKRQALDEQRRQYENRLTTISSQKKNLTLVFYQCISQKDRKYWETKLEEANSANTQMESKRLALSQTRDRIEEIRKRLEEQRLEVEKIHTVKGPEYEAAFRKYMADLNSEYFTGLSQELFTGYEDYLSQIEAYMEFLKNCVGQCMKRNLN